MKKIYLRPAIKLFNYSAFIQFPYDSRIISCLRDNFVEKFWHANLKLWEIPITDYKRFLNYYDDFIVINEIEDAPKKKTKKLLPLPEGFNFKTEPKSHQLETIKESQTRFCFLLADEPGVGKTKQIIDIARLHKFNGRIKKCLIICGINSSKWNWVNEIKKHSDEKFILIGERLRKNGNIYEGGNAERLEDLKNLKDELFVITNIQSLRQPSIVKAIRDVGFDMIALDESHKCNNPTADQTKGLLKLDAKIKIPMTGTPVLNKPIDFYVVLKWLGVEHHSFGVFKNHYCVMGGFGGYQIVGYKNMQELRDRVEEIQIRRRLEDCKDMPPIIWKPQILEMPKYQSQLYADVKQGIIERIEKVVSIPNPLTEFIRLRQTTSYPPILADVDVGKKFEKIIEICEDARDNGVKVLIYSNWAEVILPLKRVLRRFNPALIVGGMGKAIEAEKEKLSQEKDCICAVGTIGAMGTAHDLPAASWVVFIDYPWTAGDLQQAIDRTRRIEGTTKPTVIYPLICRGTVDERVKEIVEQKKEFADFLVDGKINLSNRKKLVEFLLS